MSAGLRVAYVNIEFDRHLPEVLSFLKKESAEVVLLNELLDIDVPFFETELGMKCFFVPQTVWKVARGTALLGHGVFSAFPVEHEVIHYAGLEGAIVDATELSFEEQVPLQKYTLVVAKIKKENEEFSIGLTHFPWTPDGEASDFQRDAFRKLVPVIHEVGEFALFGDFNAPRGKEIFSLFSAELQDNIPVSFSTSLDENLHRVGLEKFRNQKMNTYMVDGCFTTQEYDARDVSLRFGVSDHAAITALITKN